MRAAQHQNLPIQRQHVSRCPPRRAADLSPPRPPTCPLTCPVSVDFFAIASSKFHGKPIPLDTGNMLLRGCVLRNTEEIVGLVRRDTLRAWAGQRSYNHRPPLCVTPAVALQVIYAGHETKAMLNNTGPRSKRSKLERAMNTQVGDESVKGQRCAAPRWCRLGRAEARKRRFVSDPSSPPDSLVCPRPRGPLRHWRRWQRHLDVAARLQRTALVLHTPASLLAFAGRAPVMGALELEPPPPVLLPVGHSVPAHRRDGKAAGGRLYPSVDLLYHSAGHGPHFPLRLH